MGSIGTNAASDLRMLVAFRTDSPRIGPARVKAAIIENAAIAASQADAELKDAFISVFSAVFASDSSYSVRAACIRGLGVLKAERCLPTVLAALEADSQHDQIRKAAVAALADMDRADGLPLVLARTAAGNSSSLRPEAAAALVKLAHHDPDRVFSTLAALLEDREVKMQQATGKALSEIGGARARTLFEQRLATVTSAYWKGKTRGWMRDLKEEKAASADR